jgi:DNA integrity scanning protein DisA with diadenylate cyclase activity
MWMNFGIKDLIDILLVAFFLYQTYKLMKGSGTIALFSGVVSFIIVWILVSQVLEMRLMGAILDKFISVGFIVLVILFQDEIRRFLLTLGSHRGWKFLANLFRNKNNENEQGGKFVAPVVLACMNMAKRKTGGN